MRSPWHRSKGFRVAAVLVGLLLVAVLVVPYLLSLERYRPQIIEQLEELTGREVELGSIRLHLLPELHVSVGNVGIKNPPDFPEGDTVSVGSIDIGLAFRPLLRREVEITSVEINSVEAKLLTDERGRTNYDFSPRRKPRKAKSEEEAGFSVTQVGQVALRGMRVAAGRFQSRQKEVSPDWAVAGINVDVRNVDLTDPRWLRKAEADMDLSSVEISVPALKQPLRFPGGKLQVRENAAQGDFRLALGSLAAEGTLKVANLEKPVADFALSMQELNVAEVSALAAAEKKGGSGPSPGRRGRASRDLLARGTVRVNRVRVPPYSARNVQGTVRLYGDRLVVNPFTLEVYGGKTQGDLLMDLDNPSVPVRVNLKAEGVDVAQAMASASPEAKDTITGRFETAGQLNLPLGPGDPLAGLTGRGTFAVRDGTFPGLNVEGTLAKMAKFMAVDVPQGDTRFSYFGGDYRIADQRVHSQRVELRSEALEATINGSFGFDQTLDYSGSGLLKGSGQAQEAPKSRNPFSAMRRAFGKVVQESMGITRMRVPFSVRGTFQEPRFIVTGPPTPIS